MPGETQPLIPARTPPTQIKPLTAVDKRKKDKGIMKSSLDIVFSYSRSQQLFFGSHLPSAPSFVASDHASDSYYFNPSVASRASQYDPNRGIRRKGKARDDLEAGHEDLDSTVEEGETEDEDADGEQQEDDEGETEYEDTPARKSRSLSKQIDDQPGVFSVEHSPSPSRQTSPTRRRAPGTSTSSALNQYTLPPPQPLVSPGPGQSELRSAQRPNYGSTASSRWASSRTITAANAFDRSKQPQAPNEATTPMSDGEVEPYSDLPSPRTQLSEAEQASSPIEPLRKRSAISLRLPTDFPGFGFTASHVNANASSTPQAHDSSAPSGPLRSRKASNMSAISSPFKRDDRLASLVGSVRRASASHVGRRMSIGVKDVRGREVEVGRSTSGQTLFNAIAVLVGIGVLAEPLAFAYAGWIGGTVLLIFFGFVTNYTAKLLARIIMSDPDCQGYSDLGIKAFGWKARFFVDVLFCCELFALSIAWIVLFGDSMHALIPHFTSDQWKCIGFFIVTPTTLLPLHLLSIPSLISLFSSLLLIIILLIDGLGKNAAPGSILHPVHTSLGPDLENYNVLGGLGLLIAGFGGHAIIPSLAIDMKSPHKFEKVVNWAFGIASVIFLISGSAGYLMFGNDVSDAIIKDLLKPKYGFSVTLNQIATWMIVINPVAKFALCSRPLNLTVETLLGINSVPPPPVDYKSGKVVEDDEDPMESRYTITTGAFPVQAAPPEAPPEYVSSERKKTFWRVLARAVVTAACVVVAIALPGFGQLMAFLGSFTTFCICVLLPLAFYTAIIPREERGRIRDAIHLVIFLISLAMCVSGTAWSFVTGKGE